MPIFDTWEGEGVAVPEDMKHQYPIGAKFNEGAAGVVIGYELKFLYNLKPAWFVVVMFEDGRTSPFERYWLKGNTIKEVLKFDTAEDLFEKAIETWK
jgi:hypothetical protein